MEDEVCQVLVKKYRTPGGYPTCMLPGGDYECVFHAPRGGLGLFDICTACDSMLQHYKSGIGYLEPDKNCPLWGNERNG
jgi:hypothetical protein